MNKMQFDLISIFPDYFSPLKLSLIGKAIENALIEVDIHDLREQASGIHKSVDDTPYGGGAGMVMSPEPWGKAIDQILESSPASEHDLIILTPAGEKLTQVLAEELAIRKHLIFACGRYEGIDYRVTEYYRTLPTVCVRELSIGDYVLGGGEVAALVTMEAIIRLIPGVLGNPESLLEESHSLPGDVVVYPNYTKPAIWRGIEVPEVLLSGNHARIKTWRREQALMRTANLAKPTRE
ncbi:MAG TPA: tRNA (guanosine(37)-N1)-methyltransferase TrmD [Candidatus Nanopelagicaceae bacterium]